MTWDQLRAEDRKESGTSTLASTLLQSGVDSVLLFITVFLACLGLLWLLKEGI